MMNQARSGDMQHVDGCNLFLFLVGLLASGLGALYILVARPSRRNHNRTCVHCGYNLYGDRSYLCPECGASRPHPWYPRPFMPPATRIYLWIAASVWAIAVIIHMIATFRALEAGVPVGKIYLGRGLLLPGFLCISSFVITLAATGTAREEGSSIRLYPLLLILLSGLLFDCVVLRIWL